MKHDADPYEVLGVARDADTETIHAAYRKAASAAHPDRAGGSAERMAAINEAWRVLSDAAMRKQYDATGKAMPPDIDNEAHQLIGGLVESAMANDHTDCFANLIAFIQQGAVHARNAAGRQRADTEELARRLKKAAKRIRRKTAGAPNMVADMLLDKAAKALRAKAEAEHGLKVTTRAVQMVMDYEQLADDPVLQIPGHWMAGMVKLKGV